MNLIHRFLRKIASLALVSFYSKIHVIGEENVDREGPIIVVSTHHNMMVDPAVLSSTFPHKRPLHYWAKSSLFTNPIASYILKSAGNIPVMRGAKDNSVLFKGSFDALAEGEAIALFPEGTSYTECRIMQVKDGAAWASLEYVKYARQHPDRCTHRPLKIIVAAITYTKKSKYRSSVIVEFGKPVSLDEYTDQFLSEQEGSPRTAVKRLAKKMELMMIEQTINAPDWETLFLGRTARDLLWPNTRSINPDYFVTISQTLIDLFCTPSLTSTENYATLKRLLITYDSLLESSRFTNADLSSLPLPSTLDPHRSNISTPTRIYTLLLLILNTLSVLIRFPIYIFPLIIHLPSYLMGLYGASLAEDEEETQAQNKLIFGFLLTFTVYSTLFGLLWAFLRRTAIGALIAAGSVWAVFIYHRNIIDDTYDHAKRLVAAWRVLVGVWIPKRFVITTAGLDQYTTPFFPPVSNYIGKAPPALNGGEASTAPRRRPRGPPSRRLVRHVLRARVDAAQALANFLLDIERSGEKVRASVHLARQFGGTIDEDVHESDMLTTDAKGMLPPLQPRGWRSSREVVRFLREQGANVKLLQQEGARTGYEKAWGSPVVSSEGEATEVLSE